MASPQCLPILFIANYSYRSRHQVCIFTYTFTKAFYPYSHVQSTFSPEGRLFQVEYSLEAIKLGSTAIGVATGQGVVLGVEKRVTSTLLETSSVEKIVEIDRHIGCAMSGLQADARSMVEHARVESQNHAFHYNEPLRVESCTQAICDLALRFGEGADGEESIMSRPFGVALLIAGYDEDGPQLYHAEPSGTFYRYDAKAIGSGSEGAQGELQNEFHKVCAFCYAIVEYANHVPVFDNRGS